MTDVRRSYQIDKATCNQNHDYSKFSTGNRVLNFYAVFFFKHDKNALEPQKTFKKQTIIKFQEIGLLLWTNHLKKESKFAMNC